MEAWLDEIALKYPELQISRQVPLREYTTFRVGGPAEYWAEPESEEELMLLWRAAKRHGLPFFLMGQGSNLLVRDGGIPGLTVHLGKSFGRIAKTGETELTAQAGALLSELSRKAQALGLAGLEFAAGIPGTVGGGAYMNAGAYGGEMGGVVSGLECFEGEKIRTLDPKEAGFSYRHSRMMENGWLITRVKVKLTPDDPEIILERMKDLQQRRKDKQPLTLPSAGSFFKRPQGDFAGRLIEAAGLKGFRVGDAMVSEKHAGFVVNAGHATAGDILSLMKQVQERVEKQSGIRLEPEVRIIGVD